MANEKKMAYILDMEQMAVDFSIGALLGIIVPETVGRNVASNVAGNPHKMVIMEAPIKLIVFWMEDLNYQELREINY